MPTRVGACGARISQAARWISGPKVILSQCFSKRSRSSSSRLGWSTGNGKISTVAPSGSVTCRDCVSPVIGPFLYGLPPGSRRVEGDAQPGEYAQSRPQEADRTLIMPVEQIVDARIRGQTVAEVVGAGQIY